MKTKILGITIPLLLLFCFACEKDKICIEGQTCPTSQYMPLAIGNHWTYELQTYNFNTFAITTSPFIDTIQVVGDTTIRGKHYYTLIEDTWSLFFSIKKDTTYLRDSIGYLVNELGKIQFTSSDFDRTLNQVWVPPFISSQEDQLVEYSIRDTTIVKITPAGVFNCLDFSGRVWTGLVWNNKKFHNCFAEEVGLVYASKFFSTPTVIEYRRLLKEYHLE